MNRRGPTIAGQRAQFLDGAQADTVRLSQSSVDCPCLGNAHLGSRHQSGDIGGIGVAVTDESFRARGLVDSCPEYPTVSSGIGKTLLQCRSDSIASAA